MYPAYSNPVYVYDIFVASPYGDESGTDGTCLEVMNKWRKRNHSLRESHPGISFGICNWDDVSPGKASTGKNKKETEKRKSRGGQHLIDNRTDKCSVVVAVFKDRFGNPGQDGYTPTQREVIEADNSKKEVILFFLPRGETKNSYDKEQHKKIDDFRNEMNQRGILFHTIPENAPANQWADIIVDRVRGRLDELISQGDLQEYPNAKNISDIRGENRFISEAISLIGEAGNKIITSFCHEEQSINVPSVFLYTVLLKEWIKKYDDFRIINQSIYRWFSRGYGHHIEILKNVARRANSNPDFNFRRIFVVCLDELKNDEILLKTRDTLLYIMREECIMNAKGRIQSRVLYTENKDNSSDKVLKYSEHKHLILFNTGQRSDVFAQEKTDFTSLKSNISQTESTICSNFSEAVKKEGEFETLWKSSVSIKDFLCLGSISKRRENKEIDFDRRKQESV